MKETCQDKGDAMLSRLRNSDLIYYIYTVLVIAAGIGALIFFYFMVTGFNIGVYDENTLIGGVYVGGLSEDEAESKVRTHVDEWLENDEVVFEATYQGYSYSFDRERLSFDVDATMDNVSEGSHTDLVVSFSEAARNDIAFEIYQEPFTAGELQDAFDVDAMLDEVERDAARLNEWSRQDMSNYFINPEAHVETISDKSIPTDSGIVAAELYDKAEEVLEDGTFELATDERFSVLDTFEGELTSRELDLIGTLLMKAILPTCLQPFEVHHNTRIDFEEHTAEDFPYYGHNIRVSQPNDLDFVFENTCDTAYDFEFYTQAGHLGVEIRGFPYLNDVSLDEETLVLEHETYTVDDPADTREGHDGRIVIIDRTISDIHGTILDEHTIVFEYYRPIDAYIYEE